MYHSEQEDLSIALAIVEDNKRFVESFKRYFSKKGFVSDIGTFLCISEFKDLRQIDFDIVILDINLPDGSGIDLVPYIKNRSPKTEILILTAFLDEERLFSALKQGASGYITKSNSLKYVESAIMEVFLGGAVISPDMAGRFLNYFSACRRADKMGDIPIQLSREEMELLNILARGLTNKEISEALHIRYRYVKTLLTKIYKKFGTSSRSEVVRRAIEMGLIDI